MASIAVCGALAHRPGRPGHALVFLSYLLGLRRLGHEVLFLDRLDSETVGRRWAPGEARNSREARWLAETMTSSGLDGCYAALLDGGETLGIGRAELHRRLGRSHLLLNVNGFLRDEELLAAPARRAYLDIDPGFAQIWEAQGLYDGFAGHEAFVTVGLNVGQPGCPVPSGGRRWTATLPPVLLDCWPVAPPGSGFTSIGSWRGPFAPLEHDGTTYGLRAHELRRFQELPRRVPEPFELALDIDPADGRDREALERGGWRLTDPLAELSSFADYRRFVQRSLGEIAIAKGVYVKTRGGWFSDRSASYLASGKPVLALDTGFGSLLPSGCGLLAFDDLDGAAAAAEEVRSQPALHAAAARAIAEEHLDSDRVLGALLERLDVG